MSAITTISPLTDIINRWFPNGETPLIEIFGTPSLLGGGNLGN